MTKFYLNEITGNLESRAFSPEQQEDGTFKMVPVSEEAIIDSMRMIWERLKIMVEPSSSIVLGALLGKKGLFNNKKVGLILSGGNVDLDNIPW